MSKLTPPSAARDQQRIAKLLARAGVASRREVERMIVEGRVALNGQVLDTPATILSSLNGVTVDGQPVAAATPARLFRYHKPAGLLTAERDPAGRLTIYDRLPRDLPRVMPVGRLDLNTEGLLLLTTDGELKRQLELPSTGVERSYRARAFGTVSQEQLEELIHGIEIEGIRYGSIDANLERRTGRNQWIEMRLKEGKNREVRRVLEYFELQVSRLIRTAYGPFVLGDLPPGAVEEIRQHDLVEFRKTLKGGDTGLPPPSPLTGEGDSSQASGVRVRAASATPRTTYASGRAAPPSPPAPRPRPVRPDFTERPARPAREQAPTRAARSSAQRDERPAGRRPEGPAPRDPRRPPRQDPSDRPSRVRADRPPARPRTTEERETLHHRPERAATPRKARPAPSAGEPAPHKAKFKRGAGWAKAKPRPASGKPSSRSTPRGGKPQPTRGRPDGSKR
jgi:23S rRNA pseudouridine2605 synthase